jgi:hypothetical protein
VFQKQETQFDNYFPISENANDTNTPKSDQQETKILKSALKQNREQNEQCQKLTHITLRGTQVSWK